MPLITRPTLRRRRLGAKRRSRGQAVVEFALILPVFLFLTVGVVDLARVFSAYIALTNGVSNAAIYAGQGGYANWCAPTRVPPVTGDIRCPIGATSSHQTSNPDNIAYQIQVEATGLNMSDIVMSSPTCTVAATGTTEDCATTYAGYYSQLTIVATYQMDLLTPIMSTLLGGPVRMTAATTAVVQ